MDTYRAFSPERAPQAVGSGPVILLADRDTRLRPCMLPQEMGRTPISRLSFSRLQVAQTAQGHRVRLGDAIIAQSHLVCHNQLLAYTVIR